MPEKRLKKLVDHPLAAHDCGPLVMVAVRAKQKA
jgi:hypothetical protein